jgi:hypothetical protein
LVTLVVAALPSRAATVQPLPIEDATGSFYPASGARPAGESLRDVPMAVTQNGGTIRAVEMSTSPLARTPAAPPIVVVLDFETNTLTVGEVEALTEALWGQLNLTGAVRLLPRQATRRWLIANDLHPFMPYGQHPPVPRVIERLRGQYMVTGTIDRVENTYALELAVWSATSEAPLMKDAGARIASLDQMLLLMHVLAGQVLETIEQSSGQRLTVLRQPGAWTQMQLGSTAGGGLAQRETMPAAMRTGAEPPVKSAASAKWRPAGPSVQPVVESDPMAETAAGTVEPSVATTTPPAEPAATRPMRTESAGTEPADTGPVTMTPQTAEATPEPARKEPPAQATEALPSVKPPVESETHPNEAESMAAQNLFDEAHALPMGDAERVKKLEQAVELAPNVPTYSRQLAFDYFKNDRFADCVKLCNQALKLTPNDSKLLMIKGSAQISLAQWDAASQSCRAAIQADPKNNYARYNLALALEMMKDAGAADAWREYLSHAANDPQQARQLIEEARGHLDNLK